MNDTLRQLSERKSVRAYEDRTISPQDRRQILEAAFQAPTAGNMMLYSIIDVTDQALKDRLAVTCDNQPFIAKAPLVLVFLADYQRWVDSFVMVGEAIRPPEEGDLLLAVCDALIAAQNAVTAAHSLGLGSCYIGDILERFEIHRELLGLPQYAVPACMLCFGYPTGQQRERRKPVRFEERHIVYENTYRAPGQNELREQHTRQCGKEGEELDRYLRAFCQRKYQSDFSREMSRSVRRIIDSWCGRV